MGLKGSPPHLFAFGQRWSIPHMRQGCEVDIAP
jgi:hypothetical protein